MFVSSTFKVELAPPLLPDSLYNLSWPQQKMLHLWGVVKTRQFWCCAPLEIIQHSVAKLLTQKSPRFQLAMEIGESVERWTAISPPPRSFMHAQYLVVLPLKLTSQHCHWQHFPSTCGALHH